MTVEELIDALKKAAIDCKGREVFIQFEDDESRLQIACIDEVWVDDAGDICIGKKEP